MPTPTNLNDLLDQFEIDVGLAHEFVKGDKTVIVVGSDGNYPSLAKIAADAIASLTNFTSNSSDLLNQQIAEAQAQIDAVLAAGEAAITNNNATLASTVDRVNTTLTTIINTGNQAIANNNAALTQMLASGNAAIAQFNSTSQSIITTFSNEAQSELDAERARINTFIIESRASVQSAVDAGNARISAMIDAAQLQVTTFVDENRASVEALELSTQNTLNTLVSESRAEVNTLVTESQTELQTLIDQGNAAINAFNVLGQTNLAHLIEDIQHALEENQAALLVSQQALANVLNEARGTVGVVFPFTNTKNVSINHSMNTRRFSLEIRATDDATVYEESISIVDNNSFVVNFVEPESGEMFVTFFLNKCVR